MSFGYAEIPFDINVAAYYIHIPIINNINFPLANEIIPANNVIAPENGARIGESIWLFPVGSSILYRGHFSIETGCESFIDQNGEPINPQFNFESLDGDNTNLLHVDTSISFRLSGDVNFRISNVGEVDITGVNCDSGF